ncbi:hypothetical protein [Modestobacter sp. URMC 112]
MTAWAGLSLVVAVGFVVALRAGDRRRLPDEARHDVPDDPDAVPDDTVDDPGGPSAGDPDDPDDDRPPPRPPDGG